MGPPQDSSRLKARSLYVLRSGADILEERRALLPANSAEKNIDSSDGDDEDLALFVHQHHTSAKHKRKVIRSGKDEDEDENNGGNDYGDPQPTEKRNLGRRITIKARTKPFAAGKTVSTRDADETGRS